MTHLAVLSAFVSIPFIQPMPIATFEAPWGIRIVAGHDVAVLVQDKPLFVGGGLCVDHPIDPTDSFRCNSPRMCGAYTAAGEVWWTARENGICYSADMPTK